jgi:hypothetical protein
MLAASVNARETVDWESPSRLPSNSAVTERTRRFAIFRLFVMVAGTNVAWWR